MPEKKMSNLKFDQGHNNWTRFQGGRVLKTPKDNASIFERKISFQVENWNQYFQNTPFYGAFVTDEKELSVPFIEGQYPNDSERLACLEAMLERGFVMADCRDKRNFIHHQGHTYPVDFGQIYTSSDAYYHAHKVLHLREINNLKRLDEASHDKEFQALCQSINQQLIQLNHYRAQYLSSNDVRTSRKSEVVRRFIEDTTNRLEEFRKGNSQAFSDYIETNQDAIHVLNENRVTGGIWKSILLTIMTGIVPALLIGVVQAIKTKGNSFLLFNRNTKTGSMAEAIQKDLLKLADPPIDLPIVRR